MHNSQNEIFDAVPPSSSVSGEERLIASLRQWCHTQQASAYTIGVGDDAAVRTCRDGQRLVVTGDTSVEGTHFDLSYMTLQEAGFKAMAANVSDCAAMGARPEAAIVQLSCPAAHQDREGEAPQEDIPPPPHPGIAQHGASHMPADASSGLHARIHEIYRGFHDACTRWGFGIVGGDITAAPCWSLAITLIGIVPDNARVVQRCTAEPGDGLWITAVPGMSGAGYDALHRMGRRQAQGAHPACTQAHIRPVPDVAAGLALAADPQVHALMDCSDGISKDAATMAARSGCGLVLQADALHRACPDSLAACAGALQRPILDYMLDAGEDYALLFAAAGAFVPPQRHWICIGRFSDTVTGVWLQQDDHTLQRVSNHGWDSLSV